MIGKKITLITGHSFFCDGIVTRDGKKYYRNGYVLWSADKVKEEEVKQEDGKSKKVHNQPSRTRTIPRKSK